VTVPAAGLCLLCQLVSAVVDTTLSPGQTEQWHLLHLAPLQRGAEVQTHPVRPDATLPVAIEVPLEVRYAEDCPVFGTQQSPPIKWKAPQFSW
jgi:hypothetical protein